MARASVKRDPAPAGVPISRSDRFVRALLGLIHVVCPLLFFTNLTRNPYYTQIVILNVGVAVCGIVWAVESFRRGEWRLPRFAFDAPLTAFLAAALISSALSLFIHASVRPGLSFEVTRVWMFTLVNCVMVLFLPGLYTHPVGDSPPRLNIWSDIVMAAVWGSMWLGFHEMKNPDSVQLMWDTYGAFLWGLAALYAVLRTRDGQATSYFHVIFSVCIVAGAYGILQYWGHDIIWNSPVQPYGGRPVSTFGNPNFLSSYLMMMCPIGVVFSLRAQRAQRWGYGLVALVSGLGLLCTLTRSTYVGLFAALVVTLVVLYQKGEMKYLRPALIAVVAFVALIFIFPSTPVTGAQSPLARFTEIFAAAKTGAAYAPWHQRILIWSSAWEMQKDYPLFGRGWGSFELFFPFFQGKFLLVPFLARWRTHANNAHNVLLEIWSQTGIVGVGMALWLFSTILASGWMVVRRNATGAGKLVAGALLGGTVGMVVDNFFGNVSIFFAVPAFLFWWNVGALSNESRPAQIRSGPLSDSVGRPLMVLFAVFCLAASAYNILRWEQEVWYFQGFKEAKTGNIQASIPSLEKAVSWFPGDVNTNYELGNSLSRWARALQQRNLTEEAQRADMKALKAYQLAINANPGYDEIYFNLGVALSSLGQLESAISRMEISLFINPVLHEVYASLGALNLKLERFQKAADVFKLGTLSFPDDKDLWNNYGYSLTKLKRNEEAFDAYKQAVTIDPTFDRGWANLAEAGKATGRQDPIVEVPGLIGGMEKLLKDKNFEGALKNARRVAEILPNSADSRLSVGNLLFYLGRREEAEKEMLQALKMKPDFAAAHANIGRLYALENKMPLAKEHLARAVEIDPNDTDTRRALEQLK